MNRLASKIVLAAAIAVSAGAAQAVTVAFGTLASGTGGPNPSPIASMTLSPSGGDAAFQLNAVGLDAFGPDAFISTIAIVLPPGSSAGPCCSNVSGGAPVELKGGTPTGFPATATGFFDFTGTGNDKVTDGETVNWTWSGPFTITSIDFFAHVEGVSIPGADRDLWYAGVFLPTPPVPEPESYAMMLAGLGVVGLLARRRRR